MPLAWCTRRRRPGGVHEPPHLPVELHQRIDRVDRGAGDGVDHRAGFPAQLVQQRGLADIGLAQQRDPARSGAGGGELRRGCRQRIQHRVQQIAGTAAVQRGHRIRLAEAQRPQRRGVGLGALVIDLVHGQDHRPPRSAQHLGHGLLGGGGADRPVDHHQHRIGGHHGAFGLRGDRALQSVGVRLPATGVHHGELAAAPERLVGHPVPGDAGDVLDDRLPAADDPVHQGRFADIRPADDGQRRGGDESPSSSSPSPSASSQPLNSLSSLQVPSPGSPTSGTALLINGLAHVVRPLIKAPNHC